MNIIMFLDDNDFDNYCFQLQIKTAKTGNPFNYSNAKKIPKKNVRCASRFAFDFLNKLIELNKRVFD